MTLENLLIDGIKPLPVADEFEQPDGKPMIQPKRYALAMDIVRYVGEPVVAVVAETQNQAQDAAVARCMGSIHVPQRPAQKLLLVQVLVTRPRGYTRVQMKDCIMQ